MSLLSNMLSRLVIAFLPRNKHLLISWLQSICSDFGAPPPKKKSLTVWCSPGTWIIFIFYVSLKMKVLFAQLCPKLCDHMDCSLPGSSVHGILQIRILEWIAILFSRGSSWPRDRTQVSYIAGRFLTIWTTREAWWLPWYAHQWANQHKRTKPVFHRGVYLVKRHHWP